MITAITIQNFKGIGERVELELRPLTLMFGPNSAGKSTVLHALQYLAEVMLHDNLDGPRDVAGKATVDLGGFRNLVHGHDLQSTLRVGVTVDLGNAAVEALQDPTHSFEAIQEALKLEDEQGGHCNWFAVFTRVHVLIAVRWNEYTGRPDVSQLDLHAVDSEHGPIPLLLSIQTDLQDQRRIVTINPGNPALEKTAPYCPQTEERHHSTSNERPNSTVLGECLKRCEPLCQTVSSGAWCLASVGSSLIPGPGRGLFFATSRFDRTAARQKLGGVDPEEFLAEVQGGLSHLLSVALNGVRDHLRSIRAIGPLRTLPPRNYHFSERTAASDWREGMAAWECLANAPQELVDRLNVWLKDRLNTGYEIRRKEWIELDCSLPWVQELLSSTSAAPPNATARAALGKLTKFSRVVISPVTNRSLELTLHDLGIGIAQLLPFVVAALDSKGGMIAVEQPELHVHPRIQAELGDLFIESVKTKKQRFLIETHSEHLILRLQRRIREATASRASNATALSSEDLVVYYLGREAGATVVRRIDVDRDGEFVQPWPDDFFDIDFYERFSK
ncbi:MAG TPA: hypothetical protein DDY91_14730 [Planctomycetaceae bacterium]|nr:hypothetical protein [Planctomycetaceae bacterium]